MVYTESLDSLDCLNIISITNNGSPSLINISNLSVTETIQLFSSNSIAIDGEEAGDSKSSQWDSHGLMVVAVISRQASQRREKRTTTDGCNDEG